MFHLLFGAAIAAPFVAFVVPLVGRFRPKAGIRQTDVITAARRESRGAKGADDLQRAWGANEFAFERAIAAYEELIDSTARRRP